MATLCLVQKCPVFNDIGPYFSILATDAKVEILSLYRGPGSEKLNHKYGHHTQPELDNATPAERIAWGILGTPDPWDESTHCLRSDGRAYPHVAVKGKLPWWGQGGDANGAAQAQALIAEGRKHGWVLFCPYPGTDEAHHVNFKECPRPGPRTIARIYRLRHTLPRS